MTTDPTVPRRILLGRADRDHLRHLAANATRFADRATHNGTTDADLRRIDYGEALEDLLSWLAGDDPTLDLIEALTDETE